MAEILLIAANGECLHVDEVRNDRHIDDHADDAKLRSLILTARQAAESKTRQQLMHARWKLVLNTFPMAGSGFAAPMRSTFAIPEYAIRLPHSPLVDVVSIQYLDMSGAWQTMPATDYVINYAMTPAIITPAFGKVWPIPMPQIGSVMVTYNAGYASPFATGGTLASNQIRVSGPVSWAVGARVNFYNSGGALPAPLTDDQSYLIASAANGVYTLTDSSGAAIAFAQLGTGRNYIGVVPDGIRSWMLLRVGSLFENREEVALLAKGKLEVLPWIDGLLAPFQTDLA